MKEYTIKEERWFSGRYDRDKDDLIMIESELVDLEIHIERLTPPEVLEVRAFILELVNQ